MRDSDHPNPPRRQPADPTAPSLSILLAEDNPANQKLAVHLLRHHGHEVQVVGDGRAALEALAVGGYDLVLMDVQMPTMDGLEATAEIRRREAGTGRHVPIVAMTAHAMKGDREKCLDAGMDDYVSKPIRTQQLLALIGRLADEHGLGLDADEEQPVFSPEEALEYTGDEELLREIGRMLLDDLGALVAELEQALDGREAPDVARAVHTLKGQLGNVAARAAFERADRLEEAARCGDVASAVQMAPELMREIERLRPVLTEYVAAAPEPVGA